METERSRYNEAFETEGTPRGCYSSLFETLERMGPEAFSEKRERAREMLRGLGATFPLPDEDDEERVLPADWVPRIVTPDHWETLSAGLIQRGRAINAWISDLYNGDQSVVPEEIVQTSVLYRPGSLPDSAIPIHVYGPDLVHLENGEYVVLEDNVRVPSGVAYSEAVRRVGLETYGEAFEPYRICEILDYYAMLRATLETAAPQGVEAPNIAIVTGGRETPRSSSTAASPRRAASGC